MKRYLCIDNDMIYTEDEIRRDYEQLVKAGEEDPEGTFEHYLESCLTRNNGSLEEIADDYELERLRRDVASDIACDEMPYGEVLEVLQRLRVFGNWSPWELVNRPVNIDEVTEIVAEQLSSL